MTEAPRHSVSVAAAIFNDIGENVLLIKRRDNGRWEPPGGVLELDETIEDGLRREVREEAGAEIEVGPLTGVYKNIDRAMIALVFRCVAATRPASSSEEASDIGWHAIADLGHITHKTFAVRIWDAMHDTGPEIRTHDGKRILPAPPPDTGH